MPLGICWTSFIWLKNARYNSQDCFDIFLQSIPPLSMNFFKEGHHLTFWHIAFFLYVCYKPPQISSFHYPKKIR
jgi:hypothetical protein